MTREAMSALKLVERIQLECEDGFDSMQQIADYGLAPYELAEDFEAWFEDDPAQARRALCLWAARFVEHYPLARGILMGRQEALDVAGDDEAADEMYYLVSELRACESDLPKLIATHLRIKSKADRELDFVLEVSTPVMVTSQHAWLTALHAVRIAARMHSDSHAVMRDIAALTVAEELRCVHASLAPSSANTSSGHPAASGTHPAHSFSCSPEPSHSGRPVSAHVARKAAR